MEPIAIACSVCDGAPLPKDRTNGPLCRKRQCPVLNESRLWQNIQSVRVPPTKKMPNGIDRPWPAITSHQSPTSGGQKPKHFVFYRVTSDEKNRDYRYERITKQVVFTMDPLSLSAKKSP